MGFNSGFKGLKFLFATSCMSLLSLDVGNSLLRVLILETPSVTVNKLLKGLKF